MGRLGRPGEREEVPMPIVGGLDIHRKQITFDYLDTVTGEVQRGQIAPAGREHVRAWLARFAGDPDIHCPCLLRHADSRSPQALSSRPQLMIWRGWMRMIGPSGSPSALAASSSASASPRTMTQRGRQGGSTSSITRATLGLALALRNFFVLAKSRPPTSIVSSAGL